MIPVSSLYDEYIDRRKLTEQNKKKPIWVYSSFPLKRGRNNKLKKYFFDEKFEQKNIVNFSTMFLHTWSSQRIKFNTQPKGLSYWLKFKDLQLIFCFTGFCQIIENKNCIQLSMCKNNQNTSKGSFFAYSRWMI